MVADGLTAQADLRTMLTRGFGKNGVLFVNLRVLSVRNHADCFDTILSRYFDTAAIVNELCKGLNT